jgi:hypothetical protein
MTTGQFWSRVYTTDFDLFEGDLVNGPINTALKAAFVDACFAVESVGAGSRPGSLASVTISMTEDGDYRLEAVSEGKSYAIVTQKCHKCLATIHGDLHPFNGCDEVLLEEIHNS